MQKLIIGLIIGAVIGAGVGYVVFKAEPKTEKEVKSVGKDRGTWPDVPCPPDKTVAMASQRLTEILQNNPPDAVIPLVLNCWTEQHNPQTWPPRSVNVHNAWMAANQNPPNWATVIDELEPTR